MHHNAGLGYVSDVIYVLEHRVVNGQNNLVLVMDFWTGYSKCVPKVHLKYSC